MSAKASAYMLGIEAGRKGLWFHEILNQYLSQGMIAPEDRLEFYHGYWEDLFDIVYENGKITMRKKKLY
jgi:hypothetical protein